VWVHLSQFFKHWDNALAMGTPVSLDQTESSVFSFVVRTSLQRCGLVGPKDPEEECNNDDRCNGTQQHQANIASLHVVLELCFVSRVEKLLFLKGLLLSCYTATHSYPS
jgi:hypothetical protein